MGGLVAGQFSAAFLIAGCVGGREQKGRKRSSEEGRNIKASGKQIASAHLHMCNYTQMKTKTIDLPAELSTLWS